MEKVLQSDLNLAVASTAKTESALTEVCQALRVLYRKITRVPPLNSGARRNNHIVLFFAISTTYYDNQYIELD